MLATPSGCLRDEGTSAGRPVCVIDSGVELRTEERAPGRARREILPIERRFHGRPARAASPTTAPSTAAGTTVPLILTLAPRA